jgi:hypothetical protein
LITKIQNYLKMSSEKDVAYIPPSKRTVGFTLLQIKKGDTVTTCFGSYRVQEDRGHLHSKKTYEKK